MTVDDLIEQLVAVQRRHGGAFADALSRLDDPWFHFALDLAQSARADQDDGYAALAALAAARLALEGDDDPAGLTAARLGGAFFDVLDAIEAERLRRAP